MNLKFEYNEYQNSSVKIIKTALLNTNYYYFRIIQQIILPLLCVIALFIPALVHFINLLTPKSIQFTMISLMMNHSIVYFSVFLVGFYLFKIINPSIKLPNFWKFTQIISWPWFIESMKASFITLLFYILLIIPGIIKTIQFSFFSFIVFFNSDYKDKKINCLKYSQTLSKGLGWYLLVICILLPFISYKIIIHHTLIFFYLTNKIFIQYLVLTIGVFIWSLVISYLNSILFFLYIIKDKLHKINIIKTTNL